MLEGSPYKPGDVMTAFNFELVAQPREAIGTSASRRLRKNENLVPAVVYGGKEAAQNVVIPHNVLIKAAEQESFYSHILNLDVAGKKQKVVLKDIQRHSYKKQIMHLDFLRVSDNDFISISVPLHFINQDVSPAAKAGATISHQLTTLDIKCKAKDLPEFIEVDLSNLAADGVFHLSDLKLPNGVSIPALAQGASHNLPVATSQPKSGASEEESTEAN